MKNKGRKILAIIFSLIAIGCAGYLIWFYTGTARNDESNEKAKSIAETETPAPKVEEEAEPEATKPEIPVNFAELQAVNPDVYAWIKIEGTNIDYPILQSTGNDEFYLRRAWDATSSDRGALFTQKYNTKDFKDYNTVIYGHRMGNGDNSMFGDLYNYMEPDYLKNHQNIIVYTPEHKLTYKIFASVVYDDRLIPVAFNFNDEADRQAYIDSVYASSDLRSQFAEDIKATSADRILTLSTCLDYEPTYRYLIEAVLVNEE